LGKFFRVFSQYAELVAIRKGIIHFFKKTYPEDVTIPYGEFSSVLNFCPRLNPGFQFQFIWFISADEVGEVIQTIELCPRIAKHYVNQENNYLYRLPQLFKLLTKTKGLKTAIHTIIKAIFGEVV